MNEAIRESVAVDSDAPAETAGNDVVQWAAVRRVPTDDVTADYAVPSTATRATGNVASPAARGLAQTFGLDVRAAVLTLLVDVMVFGGNLLSFGLLFFVGVMAAAVLGVIVFKIQMHWYGDDRESARIKAWVVALLTAIPVPLTPLVVLPCGLIGLARYLRRPR